MKQQSLLLTLILSTTTLMSSCGKDASSSLQNGVSPIDENEIAPIDGSNIDGHYQASFLTLNPHINGTIPGSANFFRKGQKFYAYVRLFAGGVRAWHMQNVYEGSRCPTLSDDQNSDGIIDIKEAEAVLGKILVPLDGDISSQSSGRRMYPLADLSGFYRYERLTSFNRFFKDLQSKDQDPDDNIIKLKPGEGLELVGRTVLVQGVSDTVVLPETVEEKNPHSPNKSLPIVCGVFRRVTETPGTPYNGEEIPGPIADVEEDQDRPAEDHETPTGNGEAPTGNGEAPTGNGEAPTGNGEAPTGNGEAPTGNGETPTGNGETPSA